MGVYRFKKTVVVSAGSGSCNTHRVKGGLCYKLFVKAATASTRFKVNITDKDSDVIRSYNFRKGTLDDEKPLVLSDQNTVNIANSSANENFTVKLWAME